MVFLYLGPIFTCFGVQMIHTYQRFKNGLVDCLSWCTTWLQWLQFNHLELPQRSKLLSVLQYYINYFFRDRYFCSIIRSFVQQKTQNTVVAGREWWKNWREGFRETGSKKQAESQNNVCSVVTLKITASDCQGQILTLLVDITLTVSVAPKDYFAASATVSRLPPEAICWTDSKTFISKNHLHTKTCQHWSWSFSNPNQVLPVLNHIHGKVILYRCIQYQLSCDFLATLMNFSCLCECNVRLTLHFAQNVLAAGNSVNINVICQQRSLLKQTDQIAHWSLSLN